MTTAGSIRARLGLEGGFKLARPTSDLILRDVFAALESGTLRQASFASERVPSDRRPYPSCSARDDGATVEALQDELRATNADFANAVLARSKEAQQAEL
jgi:DNA-binding IscR family transcriptional regulator